MTYIIILNYNGYADTLECIKTILESSNKNYKIILLDNNSSDNSIFLLKKSFNKEKINFTENIKDLIDDVNLLIISLKENLGYAKGNNIGLSLAKKQSDCKYVWILNNDTLLNKDSLNNIVKSANNGDLKTIWGNKVLYLNGKIQSIGGRINRKFLFTRHNHFYKNNKEKKININNLDYIPGCSMFFDISMTNIIGMFPEEYFMYYEDVDFCYNAVNKGVKLKIAQNSIVFHKEGKSIKREKMEYIAFINRIKFSKKYFPNLLTFVYISILYQILKNILLFRWSFVYKIIINLIK